MAVSNTDDELERGATAGASGAGSARGRGPALADEGPDELPALLAFAVSIAVLVIALIWPTIRDDALATGTSADESAAEEVADDETTDEAGDAGDEAEDAAAEGDDAGEEDEAALPDIPAIQAALDGEISGIVAEGDANTVILTGTVPDEAAREALIALVMGQPNVDGVDADGLVVAPTGEAAVDVTAAQVSIVLEGTVPDEATRDELVARAVAVYSEAQVDDRLVVDPGVQPPVRVSIGGAMTDPVLHGQVTTAFDGIDGVEVDAAEFTLEESSDLEASLNDLEPVQFASGSAVVEPASAPVLDEAAELLLANPDVSLEIGGHTDSLGGAEANQSLSEARAEAVLAELRARGVENELSAVGFGERRLLVSPDENDADAQQQNRRIEFRIIG